MLFLETKSMKEIIKKYSNGEVTVVWKPDVCIHSAICFNGLPDVFDPRQRPWVKIEGASTRKITDQVNKCPSGALSYFMNSGENSQEENTNEIMVEITKNGPILIHRGVNVRKDDGTVETITTATALCRCGGSGNKPYCNGTHLINGFIG